MTARNQPLCGHQCVCPEWTDITKPCDANSGGVFVCSHDTRRSDATKAEPHDRLKCPKCNGPVFIANIDDVDTILCYDDTCKWKQKIVAEPAEQRIADVIAELERRKDSLEIFTVGKEAGMIIGYEEALALLRGKEE